MNEQQNDASVVTVADTIREMHRYLEDQRSREALYGVLRSYVRTAHIVPSTEIDDEAYELLHSVVVRATEIAHKYHGTGITSWLLSIAKQLISQKRKSQTVRQKKVVQPAEFKQEYLSEEEFFERFTTEIAAVNAQETDLRQDLKEAIESLSEDDQRILNLHIQYGYNHNEIARHLGIKPGAARVRYSRAVSHLSTSYNENKGGERDA